jgi:hypothetical protein
MISAWGSDWKRIEQARGSGAKTFRRKNFSCRLCDKHFKKIQELRWHMKKEHK